MLKDSFETSLSFSGASSDAASLLSQQASKPGDYTALHSVKDSSKTASLPDLTIHHDTHGPSIEDEADKPPTLNKVAIETIACQLHDAIHSLYLTFLWNDPNVEKINQLLGPLGAADRQAVESAYHDIYGKNGPADTLRSELKERLDQSDFRHCESTLNSKDGVTNDAGALMTALARTKDDPKAGSAEVRAVMQTLNSQQLAKLDADFKAQYGKTYLDALHDCPYLSKATRDSLPYLEKGVDKRTAADLFKLARIALEDKDSRLFAESMSGDSKEAASARQHILTDNYMKQLLVGSFPSQAYRDIDPALRDHLSFEQALNPMVLDFLKEGRISLTSIISVGNSSTIELAVKNAIPSERQDFVRGQELALGGKNPTTLSKGEQHQLEFYNKLHNAFQKEGNDRQTSIWEDQLIHGRETIISQMARSGSGRNNGELLDKVENLSREDWQLLRGADGDKFRNEIENSLKAYAPEYKDRVMQMLKDKTGSSSYEDGANIHRSFYDTAKDTVVSLMHGWSSTSVGKVLIDNIMNMSPADAAKYKNDLQFRKNVDKVVSSDFTNGEQILARQMLNEVAQTGKPPKISPIETVINGIVQGASNTRILADAERALQDQALRKAMSKPDSQLSPIEKTFKDAVTKAFIVAIDHHLKGIHRDGAEATSTAEDAAHYTMSLLQTGQIPADLKSQFGFPRDQVIASAVSAPPGERARAMTALCSEEQSVVNGICQNADHKPDLADRIRMMAIGADGSPDQFRDELGVLSSADKQKLKDEYSKKYGKDLDQDFLNRVDTPEKTQYENLLRPAGTDGRQTFYDNRHRMLNSENGYGSKGTSINLERANAMDEQSLEEFQKVYKTLPPEKQQALDQYFNKALEHYKDSKERLAEIVIDATITAACLAAAPLTGGASIGVVMALASAAGAAFRVGALKLIEGKDFNGSPENLLKQIIIGGATAAFNFVGADIFAGPGALAKDVSQQAIAGMATGSRNVLSESGREFLANGLPELIASKGKSVSEHQLLTLLSKAAPAASEEERQAMARGIKQSILLTYDETQAHIAEQIASRTREEVVAHCCKEMFTDSAVKAGIDIGSDVIVAPLKNEDIDWNVLAHCSLHSAALGAIVPVAFKSIVEGAGDCVDSIIRVTNRADGLYIDPKNNSEPITVRNRATGEVRVIEPFNGALFKLTNDWQPESGGRPINKLDHLRNANGNPVNNPAAH